VTTQHQPPSPALLLDALSGYQKTAVVRAAIEMDVFSAIADGKTSAAELAEARQASVRGMRILCDYLVANGFLTKDNASYGLTADSAAFLNRRSPAYLGGCIDFLLAPQILDAFKDVTAIVRKGGTVMPEEGTIAPEHPIWEKFARAMAPMMAMPAQLLAQLVNGDSTDGLRVLDIAASHGSFGIALATLNPHADVVALDWPKVLEVALENAERAGVANRFSIIPGNAFEVAYGRGYDVVLLPNFLHHFDAATCETLLRRVHAALGEGGRAVVVDFIPNEDRVSPPVQASFAMTMLGGTPRGDVYTYSQLEAMCRGAGFSRTELHPLPPTPQQAVIAYR